MKKFIFIFAILVLTITLQGCHIGLAYTHVKEPFSTRMRETPVGTHCHRMGTERISDPTTMTPVYAEWGSLSPYDAIANQAMTKTYYADIETTSYVLGIWERQVIWVCGE